jgi:hypothetical protein
MDEEHSLIKPKATPGRCGFLLTDKVCSYGNWQGEGMPEKDFSG